MLLAVSATKVWKIKSGVVNNAYLQGEWLDRDVYMEPPIEMRRKGKVWKLKKSAYGLYDASRNWFLAVRKELLDLGMAQLTGDDAVFYLMKQGRLVGLCILHVDDFLTGGTVEFESLLDDKLKGRFQFGKIELKKFKFTGLNIEQTDDGIYIDQIDYIQSLQPIKTDRFADKCEKLS